jgi:hypothetical protein
VSGLGEHRWRLAQFASRVTGVVWLALWSADQRWMVGSGGFSPQTAAMWAPITAGLVDLTRQASRCTGGTPPRQTLVDLTGDRLLCLVALESSAYLVVLGAAADREHLAFEIVRLVEIINQTGVGATR